MDVARVAALALAFVVLSVGRAHAYLDAGSGSMLVQLLFGGTAGLAVLVKLYWRRVRTFLGMHDAEPSPSAEVDAERRD